MARLRLTGLWLWLLPLSAQAHFFTQPYTLPVPFSIYAFGAAVALLLSFVVVGSFVTLPVRRGKGEAAVVVSHSSEVTGRDRLQISRLASAALLGLCIATGLFGRQNASANFSMTFFWIFFVLGLPYATALVGDFYAAINPWRTLIAGIANVSGVSFEGRLRYPSALGFYPALLLYMTFIWFELFGDLTPRGLGFLLLGYTLVTVVGAWAFGVGEWFIHGEFFGVFMRLIARMSPRALPWEDPSPVRAASGRHWRLPLIGLLGGPAPQLSLVLFILFMLSSTAFDGLHATLPWASLFWKGVYPHIAPWFAPEPGHVYALSARLYYLWQWCSLLISPLVYLAVFAGFVWAVRCSTRSQLSMRELISCFAPTLVPIAFVYHVTHYYTVLLAQAGQIIKLVSDPFGFGWNIFGTARLSVPPLLLDVETIWHTQVVLIVLGHIASVYLAHLEALRLFKAPGRAALSQLPMLVLMMLFTTLGLWILSLPLAPGG